jgi:CubicO group peptidase (beta-lactamase class C family)
MSAKPFVFIGETFPAIDFDKPAEIEKLIGPYTVSIKYYGPLGEVFKAEKPGPYFADVTVLAKGHPAVVRRITLFRAVTSPEKEWQFNSEQTAALALRVGVDASLVEKHETFTTALKGQTFDQLAANPSFARFIAGLAVMPRDAEKITKQNDAFAYERQQWVKLFALEAKPFDYPLTVKGQGAREVREGTEAEAGVKPGTAEKIDAVLTAWAADDDQAFAVCIVRRGVIVLHKAYGTRDGKPMTVDTPSWMASITKTMSATGMMMLVDAGRVKLDDPVSKFTCVAEKNRVGKPLLIRNLYTHTSGLARWPGELQRDELPDIEQRAALALPYLKIGHGFWYGGQGYALGGKVIENDTGEAMPMFFKKHLLEPLGMTHTEVTGTHADAYSVPLDMAKFGQMLLNKGAYGKHRFFSEETFSQMLPHKLWRELGEPETATDVRVFGIGLDGQPNKFGHGAASAATFSVDMDRELVVVMTRNRQGKNQDKYNGKFWDAINAGIEKK